MIPWLRPGDAPDEFPPVETALTDPNGLLCAGGDLTPARLLAAYRRGIFPWYAAGQPILWWSPDPRAVLRPGEFHVSRSLAPHAQCGIRFRSTAHTPRWSPLRDGRCARAPDHAASRYATAADELGTRIQSRPGGQTLIVGISGVALVACSSALDVHLARDPSKSHGPIGLGSGRSRVRAARCQIPTLTWQPGSAGHPRRRFVGLLNSGGRPSPVGSCGTLDLPLRSTLIPNSRHFGVPRGRATETQFNEAESSRPFPTRRSIELQTAHRDRPISAISKTTSVPHVHNAPWK